MAVGRLAANRKVAAALLLLQAPERVAVLLLDGQGDGGELGQPARDGRAEDALQLGEAHTFKAWTKAVRAPLRVGLVVHLAALKAS